jgi:heme-degrading monooxygenase HmoA
MIWEFMVREGREAEFEGSYGPTGEWKKLFEKGAGFLGTGLYRDEKIPRRYLTMDRWTSSVAYEKFRQDQRSAYEALDARCSSLTETEIFLGAFQERL